VSPPVAVAVVSWNTRQLLVACLDSLGAEVAAGRAEVWVVDNASTDGSAQAARERAPWANVLEPGENLGFGRAVNLAAARSSAPWLLCANADVALEPGALTALLATGEREARVGAVAPRLVLPDGTTQHSVYPLPTIGFALGFNLGLPRLIPGLGNRWCLEGRWDPLRPRTVPWAIGACLLLRRSAFDAVGGFDGRQWMYAEDLDVGWRLDAAGWRTRYEPAARVGHVSAAATSQAFGTGRRTRFTIATYEVIAHRAGRGRARAIGVINVLGAGARLALLAPGALLASRRRAGWWEVARWLRAHVAGVRVALA
jgi:GT2 family glycosyltransferase